MTIEELEGLTVKELRQIAKERHIVLGAGIDKDGIVQKIADSADAGAAVPDAEASETAVSGEDRRTSETGGTQTGAADRETDIFEQMQFTPAETVVPKIQGHQAVLPQRMSKPVFSVESTHPAPVEESEPEQAEPQNPAQPVTRFSSKPSYQATPNYSTRTSWSGSGQSSMQRVGGVDARGFALRQPVLSAPRFGPGAGSAQVQNADSQPAPQPPQQQSAPQISPQAHFSRTDFAVQQQQPAERKFGDFAGGEQPQPVYQPGYQQLPREPVQPAYTQAPGTIIGSQVPDIGSLSLQELLETGEYESGGGVLEIHPEGYGFLREPSFLPTSKDIYVSLAQVRRFGLRTGDYVEGKIRPKHEGDRFAAMLYITFVNGISQEEVFNRPIFDELTPTMPAERIRLESRSGKSQNVMRLIDLITPIGFGQRALVLAPPETGKQELLCSYARAISENYPDKPVFMLMANVTPEDATHYRETVPCPVIASTFDQPPEAHLRLADMVLERSMRFAEQQKDVVLLVDSLTTLAKVYSTSAAQQQGRSVQGQVNPTSLFRAKRLFGAARALREGGSLTVIAAMDVDTGSKVDDSVVEEFKGTANMEIVLDQAVAESGIIPAINLRKSSTKNSDLLLTDQQKEGLELIRTMLASATAVDAVKQIQAMMEKTENNDELLVKIKEWCQIMKLI